MLPDSAFARITLLIAGVLIITLLASVFMFGHYAAKQRARGQIEHMLDITDRLLVVIRSEGISAGKKLLHEDPAYQGFYLREEAPAAVRNLRLRPVQYAMRYEIISRIGANAERQMSAGPPLTIWMKSSRTANQWLGLPLKSEDQRPPLRLVLWLCLIGLLIFITAYLFTRHFTRPLVELANATRYIARGAEPPPIKESGPREIRELGQAIYRAAKDVRQISRDRELLLAGVSHDLRTPLARLRFAAEMLPGDDISEELRTGMVYDIEEMDAIIAQFLSFIRDGSDESPQNCSLNDLIAETVKSLNRNSNMIEVDVTNMPYLLLRPVAIQRLLTNLLKNALQHGKPPVNISTGTKSEYIFVAVRDHGAGIAASKVQELLRPFSRIDTARSSSGSGLGLAIVDRIIGLHGGSIFMTQSATGFEVRVEIPLRQNQYPVITDHIKIK